MFYLAAEWGDMWTWVFGVLILVFVIFLIFVSKFVNLWIQATLTKANISLFALVGMSLRKVSPTVIARARISAVQAGVGCLQSRLAICMSLCRLPCRRPTVSKRKNSMRGWRGSLISTRANTSCATSRKTIRSGPDHNQGILS